eukprot:13198494-Alexandrium_andersonii.AAC.1
MMSASAWVNCLMSALLSACAFSRAVRILIRASLFETQALPQACFKVLLGLKFKNACKRDMLQTTAVARG